MGNCDYGSALMPFGKYLGRSLSDIWVLDPQYLRWAASELNGEIGNAIYCYIEDIGVDVFWDVGDVSDCGRCPA